MTVLDTPVQQAPPVRPPRRHRWRALLVAVVLLLGVLGWVVGWSPVLTVRRIDVVGGDPASAAQARQLAGSALGTPLARVPTGQIATQVQTIASVQSVQVQRHWPSTLVLVLTDRVPVAAVATVGGYALVDASGTSYSLVRTAPAGLPLLTGADGPGRTATLAVLAALPEPLLAQVRSATGRSDADVVLTLASGTRIGWGAPAQSSRKVAIVLALLPRRPAYVDVSAPDLPATRGTLAH